MAPAFLDIVVAFALFRRSAINLPIIVTLFHNTIFTLFLLCASTPSPLRSYNINPVANEFLPKSDTKIQTYILNLFYEGQYRICHMLIASQSSIHITQDNWT